MGPCRTESHDCVFLSASPVVDHRQWPLSLASPSGDCVAGPSSACLCLVGLVCPARPWFSIIIVGYAVAGLAEVFAAISS